MVFLLNAPLLAQSIPNWPAPRFWTPPRAAALLEKIEKPQVVQSLGIEALPSGPLPFFGITPCRIADTRGNGFTGQAGPPALSANVSRSFQITGTVSGIPAQCGIPAGAQAVSFQFTVIQASSEGNLIAWPSGPPPSTSVLNWAAGIFALGNGTSFRSAPREESTSS
jgi:hypothetical protein